MKYICLILVLLLSSCNMYKEEKINPEPYERKVDIQEITMGEASTEIIDNGQNRVSNILTACEKISGTKLSSKEEFSFNEITGRKTEKNGYKTAPVLVDGEKSYGIGGGVCQVSSTIYMAALNAGLEITEHHNHSESVAYAPGGMDATVVYGVKDFCFINNTDDDIYIYAWVENEQVLAKIILKEKK